MQEKKKYCIFILISHCFDVSLQRKWLISSHRKQKYNYKIKMEKIKTLIIGSGPAGYTAANLCRQSQSAASTLFRYATGRTAHQHHRGRKLSGLS